jgi:proton-coupled amino acid transporter
MQVVSVFALLSTVFFVVGVVAIVGYTFTLPNQAGRLPEYTNFIDTITFIGISMYAYEGQTMVGACIRTPRTHAQILPVENKLRHPEDFRHNCGVLPTTMALSTILLTAVGFFGYTAFGDKTAATISLNLPPFVACAYNARTPHAEHSYSSTRV